MFKVQGSKLHKCARVARLRFDEGFTSYIEALDAERTAFLQPSSYTRRHTPHFSARLLISTKPWAAAG